MRVFASLQLPFISGAALPALRLLHNFQRFISSHGKWLFSLDTRPRALRHNFCYFIVIFIEGRRFTSMRLGIVKEIIGRCGIYILAKIKAHTCTHYDGVKDVSLSSRVFGRNECAIRTHEKLRTFMQCANGPSFNGTFYWHGGRSYVYISIPCSMVAPAKTHTTAPSKLRRTQSKFYVENDDTAAVNCNLFAAI